MNLTVNNSPVKFEIEMAIVADYNATVAYTTDFERDWDGKKVRCCFSNEHCSELCGPKKDIKLQCKHKD